MIPLRRQLIVEEHETLIYPEGTACADVLIAGECGGSIASRVFLGLGLGGIYTLFQNENLFAFWPRQPDYRPDFGAQHLLKGSAVRVDCAPEYSGVGYIIGLRVSEMMLAGGVFSWLVLMPAIYFFGSHLTTPRHPGTALVKDMSLSDLLNAIGSSSLDDGKYFTTNRLKSWPHCSRCGRGGHVGGVATGNRPRGTFVDFDSGLKHGN
jgi:OPT oligopeptide transporter protein